MTESELQREILLKIAQTGARLFRNNVAEGWIGAAVGPLPTAQTLTVAAGSVIIAHARRLHSGLCVGSSDLIGFTNQGKFLAVEVKSKTGRLTEEQRNFLRAVNAVGGIGIEARDVDTVLAHLTRVPFQI